MINDIMQRAQDHDREEQKRIQKLRYKAKKGELLGDVVSLANNNCLDF